MNDNKHDNVINNMTNENISNNKTKTAINNNMRPIAAKKRNFLNSNNTPKMISKKPLA